MAKTLSYHVSRMTFFSRYLGMVALLVIGLVIYRISLSYTVLLPFVVLAIAGLLISEIKTRNHKIMLGPENIMIESGVFSKNVTKIDYVNISDTRIRQTATQRIFNYGDIEIGVPGAYLQQNFSGRGEVTVNAAGMHPGVVLKNFQKINEIERYIRLKISERRRS